MYTVIIKQYSTSKKFIFFDKLKAEAFAINSKTNLNTITIKEQTPPTITKRNIKIIKG